MTEIVWQDPPAAVTGGAGDRTVRQMFIRSLREQPGRWAVYPCSPKAASSLAANFRKEGFDAVTRRVDGETKLYVQVPA